MGFFMMALDALRAIWYFIIFIGTMVFLCVVSPICFLNKPLRKKGWPEEQLPANIAFVGCAKAILLFGGVNVVCEAPKGPQPKSQVIFAYNHTSNLDPIIVAASCGTAPKFIYKKELAFVPLLGWVLYLYNNVAIDRKNKSKAIDSINAAVKKVVQKHQAIAIAPEGTRSRSGELMEFKKGPFHMAKDSGAKIVPVVITGAYELCPPKSKWFTTGSVRFSTLPPINPEKFESVDDMCSATRNVFEANIKLSKSKPLPKPSLAQYAPCLVMTFLSVGFYLF